MRRTSRAYDRDVRSVSSSRGNARGRSALAGVAFMLLSVGVALGGSPVSAGVALDRSPGPTAVPCGPDWALVPSSAVVKNPKAITVIAPNDLWVVGDRDAG